MAITRYSGRHGQMSINGTIMVGLDKWDLDLDTPMTDATGFGDANQIETQGIPTRKGTFSGYFDSASAPALMAAVKATTPADLVLIVTTDIGTQFAGPAWLTAKWDVSAKETVKISGKFTAADAWTDSF